MDLVCEFEIIDGVKYLTIADRKTDTALAMITGKEADKFMERMINIIQNEFC